MPKELTMYECQICGARHMQKYHAEECEQSHYIPEKVLSYEFNSKNIESEYLDSVVIRIIRPDGCFSNVRYFRNIEGR